MRKWIYRKGEWIYPGGSYSGSNLFQITGMRDDGQYFYRNNWFHHPITKESIKVYEDNSYTIFDIWLDDKCYCHVIGGCSVHCKIHGDYLEYIMEVSPNRLLCA